MSDEQKEWLQTAAAYGCAIAILVAGASVLLFMAVKIVRLAWGG